MAHYHFDPLAEAEIKIRRLAEYQRISGICWIVLGVLMCLCIIFLPIGIWNIIAGCSRFPLAADIEKRDATVPEQVEGLTGYVLIGIANFLLGGMIGLIFLGCDLYIRDKILCNRQLFDQTAPFPQKPFSRMSASQTEEEIRLLEELFRLREKNILTEQEFQNEKAKILN